MATFSKPSAVPEEEQLDVYLTLHNELQGLVLDSDSNCNKCIDRSFERLRNQGDLAFLMLHDLLGQHQLYSTAKYMLGAGMFLSKAKAAQHFRDTLVCLAQDVSAEGGPTQPGPSTVTREELFCNDVDKAAKDVGDGSTFEAYEGPCLRSNIFDLPHAIQAETIHQRTSSVSAARPTTYSDDHLLSLLEDKLFAGVHARCNISPDAQAFLLKTIDRILREACFDFCVAKHLDGIARHQWRHPFATSLKRWIHYLVSELYRTSASRVSARMYRRAGDILHNVRCPLSHWKAHGALPGSELLTILENAQHLVCLLNDQGRLDTLIKLSDSVREAVRGHKARLRSIEDLAAQFYRAEKKGSGGAGKLKLETKARDRREYYADLKRELDDDLETIVARCTRSEVQTLTE